METGLSSRERVSCPKQKEAGLKDGGQRNGQERRTLCTRSPKPILFLHPVPRLLSASTRSQKSPGAAPDLTAETGGSGLPREGRRPAGARSWPLLHPCPSGPRGTHQAARHRKCRRAKLTREDVAIAGTFLAETIFATCHTLSLFTFPGSQDALSRVRGEGRGSPRRAHTRAHTRPRSHSPALSQPERRWARVCTRARGRRNLPSIAPSFSR